MDRNNAAFLSDLLRYFGERLDVYYLEPGYIHTFRFDLPHTVVNEGNDHRYTPLLDYLENDWLEEFAGRMLTGGRQSGVAYEVTVDVRDHLNAGVTPPAPSRTRAIFTVLEHSARECVAGGRGTTQLRLPESPS